jgi:hypothetical protein
MDVRLRVRSSAEQSAAASKSRNVLLRIASRRFFDSDSFLANKLESDRERGRGAVHRSISDAGERSAPEMRRDVPRREQ